MGFTKLLDYGTDPFPVHFVDKIKVILVGLFFCLYSSSYAEWSSSVDMFTMSNGRIISRSRVEMTPFELGGRVGIEKNVTGFYVIDLAQLSEIDTKLKQYLLNKIEMDRISDESYKIDDIVFGFDGYYLQFIPCYYGKEKVVFINAYKHEGVKTPAEQLVTVYGGGVSYWTASYYLETKQVKDLDINQDF